MQRLRSSSAEIRVCSFRAKEAVWREGTEPQSRDPGVADRRRPRPADAAAHRNPGTRHAPGSPAALLGLQRSIGNAAVSKMVVQRYTVINPADYVLGVGSQFATQGMARGVGTAYAVRDTREQTATGMVDTHENSAGQGVWNKTLDRAPTTKALPSLKYGTDGTDGIGIENTTDEAKVFYATPGVLAASNTKLAAVGAEARLVDAGGSLDAPKNPALPLGPKLNMHMMKPGVIPKTGAPRVLETFGSVSECNTFIKTVVGDVSKRVALFGTGAGHEAEVKEEKEPTQAIANFASGGGGNGQALATHLTTTGTKEGEHENPLPNAYTGMGGKTAHDQALGINAGAKAGVGEGYVITQNSPMPDDVTVRAWLDALDKKMRGLAMTPAELDMFKHKWGYRYAGIVAQVGDDAVSLENYNRGTPMHWELDDLYNARITAVAGLRRWLETVALTGEEVPSIPMERNKWLNQKLTALTALGTAADADQVASRDALAQVVAGVQGLQVDFNKLWHFKMYGTAGGQSFHEQWQGALEDPMTLRIAQSVTIAKAQYKDLLVKARTDLMALNPSVAAQRKLQLLTVGDLVNLDQATSSDAVDTARWVGQNRLLTASASAMHDWTVEAAVDMGKKPRVVTPLPPVVTGLDVYKTSLLNLIDGWRAKGSQTKEKDKIRRARLMDLRVKVYAAQTKF